MQDFKSVIKINKSNIIELLSKTYTNLPCHIVNLAIKQIIISIKDALIEGKKIELRKFGGFSVKFHLARLGRNPKTGKKINISSTYTVHFSPGKELNARINKKPS